MTISIPLHLESTDTASKKLLYSLSSAVVKSKRVVVVSGAGISCSSGIPDFRSTDGLYNLVKSQYPDVVLKGRDLFDSSLFRDTTSTSVFYTFISQLKSLVDQAEPSMTHKFIKTLDSKGKLLRSYTQNIDGFEERVGLSSKSQGKQKAKDVRNVLLHGNIHEVRCRLCNATASCTSAHLSSFLQGSAPDCDECNARSKARMASSRRPLKVGTLRPAIVLYDEIHPEGESIGAIQTSDLAKRPDLLIVMGTSLKVFGLKKLVKEFATTVHATSAKNGLGGGKVIFVNLTKPSGSEWDSIIDYHIKGTTDAWVSKVEQDWRKMRPADWEIQSTLLQSSDGLKVHKHSTSGKEPKRGKENIPPVSPPLSPSKRQSKHSHYDKPSSPNKKRELIRKPSLAVCGEAAGAITPAVEDPFLLSQSLEVHDSAKLNWLHQIPMPEQTAS